MNSIAFVTTCKGRLHHIQQTLPLIVAERPDQIIVVDYDCPQKTGEWVAKHYPQVQVVRVKGDPGFCLPLARNAGSQAVKSEWVFFVDADVQVQPGLVNWIKGSVESGSFYHAPLINGKYDIYGSFIVSRIAFERIGGYDEAFRGWGGEDVDIYWRLAFSGELEKQYPHHFVEALNHLDTDRTAFHSVKEKNLQHDINRAYIAMKSDLMRLNLNVASVKKSSEQPPLQVRKSLMTRVKNVFLTWDRNREVTPDISIDFPGVLALHHFPQHKLNKQLTLRVTSLVNDDRSRPHSPPHMLESIPVPESQGTSETEGTENVDEDYWSNRQDLIYLHAVRQICRRYAPSPRSVLDVGSNRTPVLEWHRGSASRLVSLDLHNPYAASGVESLTQDFLTYRPSERFDLALCLQVLEHVPDPQAFAQHLLAVADVVIASVPYRWKTSFCKEHLHDPVDDRKMLSWFGRTPNYSYLAREISGVERLVHVYQNNKPSDAPILDAVEKSPPQQLTLRVRKKASISGIGCALYSIVRNEIYFMPHFFKHYRALGVDRFLIYDDGSTDGTSEFLRDQPDCTVIESSHTFGDIFGTQRNGEPRKFATLLIEKLPLEYFPDAWVVTVDADEFMILPPGFSSLPELIAEYERTGQTHATAPMVDFYPEFLRLRNCANDISPFEAFPWFDTGPLYQWMSGEAEPKRLWRGIRARLNERLNNDYPGVMKAIYGRHNHKWWAKCWKVPLLRNGAGVRRLDGHELTIAPDLRHPVALAHFKFYPGLDWKITDAFDRQQYYNASEEYRFLAAVIEYFADASLIGPESRRYTGPESLAGARLL